MKTASLFITALLISMIFLPSSPGSSWTMEKGPRDDIVAAPPPPPLETFEFPAFKKTTRDAEPHFIRIIVVLGYEKNPALAAELKARKDQLRHVINILLQGKSVSELSSLSDKITLAEEIKAHINVLLKKGTVKEVFFKEFILN